MTLLLLFGIVINFMVLVVSLEEENSFGFYFGLLGMTIAAICIFY